MRLYATTNEARASARPTATPSSSPTRAIVRTMAPMTTYSRGGTFERLSTSHSIRNVAPTNSSRPPNTGRGSRAMTTVPAASVASGTTAATHGTSRLGAPSRCASDVWAIVWKPTIPPAAPEMTFATPAARSSRSMSASRRMSTSMPLMFSRMVSSAIAASAAAAGACASTASQSATPSASTVHVPTRVPSGNGPSSQPWRSRSAFVAPAAPAAT